MTSGLLLLPLTLVAVAAAPLATVNKDPITGARLLAEFRQRHGAEARFACAEAACRAALEEVIDRQLLHQEARRLGLARDPGILRALKELERSAAADHLYKLEVADKSPGADPQLAQSIEPAPGASSRFEARRTAFHEELWAKHRVKEPRIDWSLAGLKAALASRSQTEVGSWAGGKLTMGAFAQRVNLERLAKLPLDHQLSQLENLRHELVRAEAVGLEVAARNLTRAPEVLAVVEARRADLMENKLFDDHIFRGLALGPDEEKKYYEAHRAEFTVAARRHLRQIVVATEAKAQATLKKLAAGAKFEALARTLSIDAESAKRDGDLGWLADDKLSPEFAAVLELKEGEVSAPIRTKLGFHLVKVTELTPGSVLPFEKVKDDARRVALRTKMDEKRQAWLRRLRAAAVIVINEAELQAFARQSAL